MDFLPGNNSADWRFLGTSENSVPYQQVTVYQAMKWSDFPLEFFVAACSAYSGGMRISPVHA